MSIVRGFDEFVKTAKTRVYASNLDRWGKDPKHNILYITGYSGSGKSTLAKQLADDKHTQVIHLDPYIEHGMSSRKAIQNKDFNNHLNSTGLDYDSISSAEKPIRHSKEWFKKLDKLMDETSSFADKQYKNGNKVIVEGVQLSDETVLPNKVYFKDKPIAIMKTGPARSFFRSAKRDGMPLFTSMGERIKGYRNMHKTLKNLRSTVDAKATTLER